MVLFAVNVSKLSKKKNGWIALRWSLNWGWGGVAGGKVGWFGILEGSYKGNIVSAIVSFVLSKRGIKMLRIAKKLESVVKTGKRSSVL